jgi:hypothetical protein
MESGSTAQNASARILTAQHFFQKCHLFDRKMSSAWQKKVCQMCSTCQFWAVDKKSATARQCRAVDIQFFATVKYKSSSFFI